MLPMYHHQEVTAKIMAASPHTFVGNDPGTGKTRSALEAFKQLRRENKVDKLLVLAPLSILEPAWAGDCRKWTPDLSCKVVLAKHKMRGFEEAADVYVTNHDSVKWLAKQWNPTERWAICVDEATAFKHRTSQRSKAMAAFVQHFDYRWMMTGTANSNSVLDVWHVYYLLDRGERLGRSFWGFRAQVCRPVQVGPNPNMVEWQELPHANEIVADRTKDITVRFKLEDCVDMPETVTTTMTVELPPKLRTMYDQMQDESILAFGADEKITAVHAGVVVQKLLQICAGAIYNGEGGYKALSDNRSSLVLDLVEQRSDPVLVAFNWQHQKELLITEATKRKISYAVIDGTVPVADRNTYVEMFQQGQLQVLFAHPQSAGHGLTLTRGATTIWASPTYNAEWFQQFNRRVYRTSQTKRTETILIAAANTAEERVYEKLSGKLDRMTDLLTLFEKIAAQAA